MRAAEKVLLEVYRKLGPKDVVNSKFRPVPPSVFARMKRTDVNRWDGLQERFLFQRIAKVLAKCGSR